MKRIGIALAILLASMVLYLVVVVFGPGFAVLPQPFPEIGDADGSKRAQEPPPAGRQDVSFPVRGVTVRGWLYLPKGSARVPAIVLSTGFGGTKDRLLEQYALRYLKEGWATLIIDYRYFGNSDGEPRQLFFISEQLEDLRAAIAFVRQHPRIDSKRVGTWGTSASGGYGLMLAAKDRELRCMVAQVPALDSDSDSEALLEQRGLGSLLLLFMHAQRDMGRSRFGLSPHRIPIVGRPGTVAMLTAPGALEGYARLVSGPFRNEFCPRGILRMSGYNPIEFAAEVRVPLLIQVAERDLLVSPRSAGNVKQIMGKLAEVKRYEVDHFGIYTGAYFERAVADQISFLRRCL